MTFLFLDNIGSRDNNTPLGHTDRSIDELKTFRVKFGELGKKNQFLIYIYVNGAHYYHYAERPFIIDLSYYMQFYAFLQDP
ncbi:hypothetical protein ACJX0J_035401, partial [Zea mays]